MYHYCTISTVGSQGVMHDARERYWPVFTSCCDLWRCEIGFMFTTNSRRGSLAVRADLFFFIPWQAIFDQTCLEIEPHVLRNTRHRCASLHWEKLGNSYFLWLFLQLFTALCDLWWIGFQLRVTGTCDPWLNLWSKWYSIAKQGYKRGIQGKHW